jgi:hypothetical protein
LEVPQEDSWWRQGKDGAGKEANAEIQSLGLWAKHFVRFGHVIDEHGTVSLQSRGKHKADKGKGKKEKGNRYAKVQRD